MKDNNDSTSTGSDEMNRLIQLLKDLEARERQKLENPDSEEDLNELAKLNQAVTLAMFKELDLVRIPRLLEIRKSVTDAVEQQLARTDLTVAEGLWLHNVIAEELLRARVAAGISRDVKKQPRRRR